MNPNLFIRSSSGELQRWTRTTIQKLREVLPAGTLERSDEAFLEDLVVQQPELLGIGTSDDDSDFVLPFRCFRQCALPALNGRTIFPDIIVLSQSGHAAVVEVKLESNPELRDRRVVAQVLEYAAALAELDDAELLSVFTGREQSSASSWPEFVAQLFPEDRDPERTARRLRSRFGDQDLLLAIACDKIPMGLRELVRNVVGQRALGDYQFRVIEVVPFVGPDQSADIVLLPNVILRTEVVARTAISVKTAEGTPLPRVEIEVTSLQEAEAKQREASKSRKWDEQSFFEDADARLDATTLAAVRGVYERLKDRCRFRWGTGKTAGSFSPIFSVLSEKPAFSVQSDGALFANFGNLEVEHSEAVRAGLRGLEGVSFNQEASFPRIDGWVECWEAVVDLYENQASPD